MSKAESFIRCSSGQLFRFVWCAYGWGLTVFGIPIVLIIAVVAAIEDPSNLAEFGIMVVLVPIVAFAQGIFVAAIVVAGRPFLRRRLRREGLSEVSQGAA